MGPRTSFNTLDRCRSMLLLRGVTVFLNSMVLIRMIQEDALTVFRNDQLKMERWDPSDILKTPFPIEVLRPIVFTACRSIMTPTEIMLTILLFTYQGRYSLTDLHRNTFNSMLKFAIHYIVLMFLLTVVILSMAILCGVSPFENLNHTVLAVMYLTTMMFGYMQPNIQDSLNVTVKRLLLGPDNHSELNFIESLSMEMNSIILYSTVLVTIPFGILNILDAGMQMQRWPMPLIIGSFCGHMLGIVMSMLLGIYRYHNFRKQSTKREDSSMESGDRLISPTKQI